MVRIAAHKVLFIHLIEMNFLVHHRALQWVAKNRQMKGICRSHQKWMESVSRVFIRLINAEFTHYSADKCIFDIFVPRLITSYSLVQISAPWSGLWSHLQLPNFCIYRQCGRCCNAIKRWLSIPSFRWILPRFLSWLVDELFTLLSSYCRFLTRFITRDLYLLSSSVLRSCSTSSDGSFDESNMLLTRNLFVFAESAKP